MGELDTLLARDRELFTKLRITDDILAAAGVKRVDRAAAAAILGRPVSTDLSGLHFPYLDPVTTRPNSTSAIRQDNPPIGPDGKPQGKYMFTSGRSHVYFPPGAELRVKDAGVPLIIVEAQKAVLAIECALRRAGRAALPVGVNGCWGWRGTIGKTVAADGARVDEKGVLPDFQALCLPGREAIVMFDSNVASNEKVKVAEQRLTALLTGYEMRVRVVRVPAAPGINGPDDYLAAHTDAELFSLIDAAQAPERGKRSRGSAGTELLHLINDGGGRPFHSQDGTPFLALPFKGREEIINLESSLAPRFLAGLYWRALRAAVPSAALAEAINALAAEGRFEGPQRSVFVRVARVENTVVLDLGHEDRRVVIMTPEGWRISTTTSLAFERPRDLRPLPPPTTGGDLRSFLNLFPIDPAGDTAALLAAWLVQAVGGTGSFPILHLVGEQGAGKSLCARLLKRLIDDADEPLRSGSSIRDAESIGIAAHNSYVVAIDNLSFIPGSLSDVLCAVSTGGAVGGRELYTNAGERRLKLQRPAILTSINKVVTRADLLDRTLSIEWPLLTDAQRRDERELYQEFERVRPEALGAICTAVCAALKHESEIRLPERPRLADFVRFATAAEAALNLPKLTVYTAMRSMRQQANRDELEGSVIGLALRDLCEEGWTGTAAALLAACVKSLPEGTKPPSDWPKSPRGMGDRLRQWAPVLRHNGYEVRSLGHYDDGNRYALSKSRSTCSGRSASQETAVPATPIVRPDNEPGGFPERPERADGAKATVRVEIERDGSSVRYSRPRA